MRKAIAHLELKSVTMRFIWSIRTSSWISNVPTTRVWAKQQLKRLALTQGSSSALGARHEGATRLPRPHMDCCCSCFSYTGHDDYTQIPMSPGVLLDPQLDERELLLFEGSGFDAVNLSLLDDGLAIVRRRKGELIARCFVWQTWGWLAKLGALLGGVGRVASQLTSMQTRSVAQLRR